VATTYPITRWRIGAAMVTRVVEIEGPSPGTFLFDEAIPERLLQHAWLKPRFLTDDGRTIGRSRIRRRVEGKRSSSIPASATTRTARCRTAHEHELPDFGGWLPARSIAVVARTCTWTTWAGTR
jgi:hypothetical protein